MRADNEFLSATANKLSEIADKCADIEAASELREFVEHLVDAIGKEVAFS